MQTKKPQLQRQQIIMAKLGFYKNQCDGIWGPDSIAAKLAWEADQSFIPALPTNGLPFGERDPLPKGMIFDKANRLFVLLSMTEEEIEGFTPDTPRTSSGIGTFVETETPVKAAVETETVVEAAPESSEPAESETQAEPKSGKSTDYGSRKKNKQHHR